MTESKNVFGSSLPEPPLYSRLAIGSSVCAGLSLGSLFLSRVHPGLVALVFLCIPALILGIVGRRQIRDSEPRLRGEGLALIGIWGGLVGVVLNLLAIYAVVRWIIEGD